MSGMVEVLEELWEQGNCAGLDGWIGLGRGQRNFDEEAVQIRRRDVEKAVAALTAAGFGDLDRATLMAYDAIEESALTEARAGALEEAADDLGEGIPIYASNLRARAAAVRGEG
jgi:hypothetical protein